MSAAVHDMRRALRLFRTALSSRSLVVRSAWPPDFGTESRGIASQLCPASRSDRRQTWWLWGDHRIPNH